MLQPPVSHKWYLCFVAAENVNYLLHCNICLGLSQTLALESYQQAATSLPSGVSGSTQDKTLDDL